MLELDPSGEVLLLVEALLDDWVADVHEPPYDQAPSGWRWVDAPSRAPRWVPLRPIEAGGSPPTTVALERMPRLELVPPVPAPELLPMAVDERPIPILEHARHANDLALVSLGAGQEADVQVPKGGDRARRLLARCTTSSALGGRVVLRVDGVPAAQRRFITGSIDLVAEVEPGAHRVHVQADRPVRCLVAARPRVGFGLVQRTVSRWARGSLELAVDKPSWRAYPVTLVVYFDSGVGGAQTLEVTLDHGTPRRRSGVVARLTAGHSRRIARMTSDFAAELQPTGRRLPNAVVTTVALGDDLTPGRHTLRFDLVPFFPAYARAFAPGHRTRPERIDSWIALEEGP
jgi:hypothetical protein